MSAGSDFSLEVGVRVKDDASPALQQIGRTASSTGRQVESSMRGASQQLGSLGQSASRSTAGVQSAARQWESSARRGGESAGRAAGDGLSRGVTSGARQAGDRAGGEFATGMRGRVRGLGSDIRSELMGPLMAGVAGAGIVSFLQGAIDKASDLNETVSKSKSIFGEQQAAMQQWSQGAAQSMGLSSQAALDAATSFGDMFRQLGDSGPAAAQTSQQVVQLAADLGSFNNLETGDVIDRLSASFRGEFDSLQAIIPNINAARVEQEALTATGKDSASALTQQEKAHATLAIVMRDSSRAQGDFAKTADGAANTAKRNAAAFEDLQAKVGQGLLSAFQALQGAMGGLISGASVLVDGIAKIAHVFSELPGPIQMAIGTFGALRLAQALLGNQITATGARLAALGGAFRTFSAQQTAASVASANLASNMTRSASGMGAMVRVAGGGAVQMGRFGTSIQQVGQQVPAIARAQGAFVNAAAGADRFGRSAGVAAAGGSLLKSAGSGLMGVMGGPLGLAFAGASIAAGVWAKHQQDSAQKVAEHKQAVSQLVGTLDQSTGAFTAATRAQVAKDLSDKGMLETAKQYGVSLSDVTDIYLGNEGALKRVTASLDEQQKQYGINNTTIRAGGDEVAKTDHKLNDFEKSLKSVAGSGKAAQRALQLQNEAMKQTSSAATPAKTAVQQLAEAQKKSEGASKAMVDALQKVNNAFLELRGGERGYEAAIDDATKALKENGLTLDIHTEKGRANGEALDKVAASAQTMMSDMAKNGASAGQVASQYASSRAELVKMAESFGMTAAEAGKYADKALQIPKEVKTKVDLEADAAKKAFASLKDDAVKLDGSKVVVEAKALNDKNVKAALEAIPGVQHDKQGNLIVDTKALNAEQTRLALKGVENAAVTADGRVVIIPASTPNAAAVKRLLEGVDGAAVSANGRSVSIPVASPNSPATKRLLNQVEGAALSADKKSVTVPTSALGAVTAKGEIDGVIRSANAADGKVARVSIITTKTLVNEVINRGSSNAVGVLAKARGGVMFGDHEAFARGGVREDHEPQIARPTPGRVRVWAEPETQGEAYIPFANDGRRGRAKSITEYVARRFGGSVTWHADGSADDWTPDMSGIMAYAASLKVDPSALTDQRKKVADQNTALDKAIRDLRAAQAGVRGKSGAARVKAENAVATAIERQAKAQRDLNDGKAKLNQMSAGANADTTTRFMMGTTAQNGISQRFLDNIERIRKRGFPRLARSLLEQGDADAQYIAQTLSGGALSRLESAQAGLDTSDKLADRKAQMLDDLKGANSSKLTAQAQAQANAQLLALQASNRMMQASWSPQQLTATHVQQIVTATLKSMPAPTAHVSVQSPDVYLGSDLVSRQVTGQQQSAANRGSSMIGVVPR